MRQERSPRDLLSLRAWRPRPYRAKFGFTMALSLPSPRTLVMCLLFWLSAAPSGWAAAPPVGFEATLETAKTALQQGQLDAAIQAFRRCESLATVPSERWRAWLGQALTYERLSDPLQALRAYQRFTDVPAKDLDPRWLQRQREVATVAADVEKAALKTQISVLEISSTPPGALVAINGTSADLARPVTTPAKLYLVPGRYRVSVSQDTYLPSTRDVALSLGERLKMAVELAPVPPKPTLPETPITAVTPASNDAALEGAFIGTSIVGAVLLISGATLHGLAFADADAAFAIRNGGPATLSGEAEIARLTRRGTDRQESATIFYGVGAAVGVAAIVLGVLQLTDSGEEAQATFLPAISPTNMELRATVSF